jgi:hypothetical protein
LPAAFAFGCRCLIPLLDSVSSSRHLERSMRVSRTTLSCSLRTKGYVTCRPRSAFGACRSRRSSYPLNSPSSSYSHCLLHLFQPKPKRPFADPRTAKSSRPSPWCISSASGPPDRWAPLSSRPCLPSCWRPHEQQGPLAPRTLLRFFAPTDPSATLPPSADFPFPVIRPTLLPPISRSGRVGLHQLLDVSLPACRRYRPAGVGSPPSARLQAPMLPSPCQDGSAPGSCVPRSLLRSLSLRPASSLTILSMASSMGFKALVSLLSAIQATGGLALPLAGLTPAEHASLLLVAPWHRHTGRPGHRLAGLAVDLVSS